MPPKRKWVKSILTVEEIQDDLDMQVQNGSSKLKKDLNYSTYTSLFHIQEVVDDGVFMTDFVFCKDCRMVLSKGGQRSRHAGRTCSALQESREIPKDDMSLKNRKITGYCLWSGRSFNHLESTEFQLLVCSIIRIQSPSLKTGDIRKQLTCRQTIQFLAELKGREVLCHIFDEVFKMIAELSSEMGISIDLLKQCRLVADGAANLRKCGEQLFAGYLGCSNHAINKLAERTLQPYTMDHGLFSSSQLGVLSNLRSLISLCRKISIMVRAEKAIRIGRTTSTIATQGGKEENNLMSQTLSCKNKGF